MVDDTSRRGTVLIIVNGWPFALVVVHTISVVIVEGRKDLMLYVRGEGLLVPLLCRWSRWNPGISSCTEHPSDWAALVYAMLMLSVVL